MRYVNCYTQADLDAALAQADVRAICCGGGRFVAWGSSHVEAWGVGV